MAPLRHERVRELLKREIGEIIRQNYSIDQYGLISAVDIQMGNDLKSARVFIGIIGEKSQKRAAIRRLQKDQAAIQQEVASRVILKHLPRLRFVLDASLERGNRVLEIIEKLERSEPSDSSE
ncbi:MAG: Ribosome-binding factor A [Verrucomicrobia subdivision 3 bacterium]|nr:Ribosome-binding factor A [Limisphaerales bacterium]MCS1412960.1 Ribosome-binding factor A [Limisphaerales bacterium]